MISAIARVASVCARSLAVPAGAVPVCARARKISAKARVAVRARACAAVAACARACAHRDARTPPAPVVPPLLLLRTELTTRPLANCERVRVMPSCEQNWRKMRCTMYPINTTKSCSKTLPQTSRALRWQSQWQHGEQRRAAHSTARRVPRRSTRLMCPAPAQATDPNPCGSCRPCPRAEGTSRTSLVAGWSRATRC